MPKPIRITDAIYDQLLESFQLELLKATNLFEGFTYKVNLTNGKDRAKILFEPAAYSKMMALVNGFDSEVAWHGVCVRDDENPATFIVKDILIYPQIVTGVTVETDDLEYQRWLMSEEIDPVFNDIRFQGHSHVKMSTSPSAVDTTNQRDIIAACGADTFYVFVIWNQRNEHHAFIFDMKNNKMYENSEIDVGLSGVDLDAFMKEAKAVVEQKPKVTTVYGGGAADSYGTRYSYASAAEKSKAEKSKVGNARSKKTESIVDAICDEYNWRDILREEYEGV